MAMSDYLHFILIDLCYILLGLTVLAENINRMRYMSHFRSVHRGAFFQEMRTSEPRQLLPEAWGEDLLISISLHVSANGTGINLLRCLADSMTSIGLPMTYDMSK
jgi:hypothetical protein